MGFLNNLRKNKGFTLIELLVVIAIIGILASIVLASLNSARQKSRDAKRMADLQQIKLALELYFDANNTYPPGTDISSLAPTYISQIPDGPLSGESYIYQAITNSSGGACSTAPCTYYHLGANLEDNSAAGLNADADRCASAGTGCSSALTGTTIDGDDSDGCSGEAGRYCYDITP